MAVPVVRLTEERPEADVDRLAGTLLTADCFDWLIQEDVDILRPDGTRLLGFRRAILDPAIVAAAYPALRKAAKTSDNRGMAAGLGVRGGPGAVVARHYNVKRDGTVSRTTRAPLAGRVGLTRSYVRLSDGLPTRTGTTRVGGYLMADGTEGHQRRTGAVRSGVIGYFDRQTRFPFCRQTVFNLDNPELFAATLPLIRAVDAVFAAVAPERYAVQRALAAKTSPDFAIHGTAFTTVTVNRNWQTAVHKDAGDLPAGFGVMTALAAGSYDGGYLVFPRYRIAVDMRTCDVLCADVHQWHGNTPLVGVPGRFERISCVYYYRRNMILCGTAQQELEAAKRRTSRAQLQRPLE